jgi:hypothetical protein
MMTPPSQACEEAGFSPPIDGINTEKTVQPIARQPYTLLEIVNEEADDDTTIFKFTGDLVLVKTHFADKKIEAALLAFGWVTSNYDSNAWW